jgi:hypothetical protein
MGEQLVNLGVKLPGLGQNDHLGTHWSGAIDHGMIWSVYDNGMALHSPWFRYSLGYRLGLEGKFAVPSGENCSADGSETDSYCEISAGEDSPSLTTNKPYATMQTFMGVDNRFFISQWGISLSPGMSLDVDVSEKTAVRSEGSDLSSSSSVTADAKLLFTTKLNGSYMITRGGRITFANLTVSSDGSFSVFPVGLEYNF